MFGDDIPTVQSLPRLERGDHPSWTFPLLKLLDSAPLNQYQMIFHQRPPNFVCAHDAPFHFADSFLRNSAILLTIVSCASDAPNR
jgi:hypothetical protein